MLKIPSKYEQRYFLRLNSSIFASSSCFASDGRIARELWWTNQFSPVDIIPSWFFMLMYHLGDEQEASWWSQFRDVFKPFDMIVINHSTSTFGVISVKHCGEDEVVPLLN
jgi:hypothetical protein